MDSAPSNHDRRGRRQGLHFSPPRFLAAPLLTILEYSGLLRGRHHYFGLEEPAPHLPGALESRVGDHSQSDDNRAEVSIRIIGGSSENEQVRSLVRDAGERSSNDSQASSLHNSIRPLNGNDGSIPAPLGTVNSEEDGDTYSQIGSGLNNNRDAVSQRYEFQQLARWIEQVLPFTVLLLMVFIRQHLEGFLVTFWISIVMVKTNDLLRKQTALKGDRKTVFLLAIGAILLIHVLAVYWWYWNDDLLRPLLMVPPKHVPKFWQAIFIIIVNDTVVRLAAMVVKSGILILYKHSHGRTYRRQAELMTFVEYVLLLYRALLPTPVWYRFFLNKEYGNLFSSLSTGLYLTFKLTATLEKVHRFIAAIRTLSRREVQYGSYATSEEVLAAGDLCAICQEKMHAPILLCCKHIFCEDCVSEWFERERTCPLCRAVVKSSGLRSFGDGSTSLFFQIF